MRNDYVVVGRLTALANGDVSIDAELVNVLTGQRLLDRKWTVKPANLRNAAHRVADAIYEKIIGVRGAFATRIAYVSVDGKPPAQRYQLIVADADGENPRRILQSDRPLMSPAWSPDGAMAGVRVVRAPRVGGVRAERAHRAAQPGVGARRHQRRAVLVAGRQEARAHAVGQQRQSRYLSTRPRHAAADAAHRESGHRHRGVVHARWQGDLLHLGSFRQPAGVPADARQHRAARGASPSPVPTMRGRGSRPTASSWRC